MKNQEDERLKHVRLSVFGHPRWILDGHPVSRRDRRVYLKAKKRAATKSRRSS